MDGEEIKHLSMDILDSLVEADIIPHDWEYDIIVAREILYNKLYEYFSKK